MHAPGTFFDARLNDKDQYPVAAKSGAGNVRSTPDKLTSKLAALHFYQLAIPAPTTPAGSHDKVAFERGKTLFAGQAKCATCHVPPLFTERDRRRLVPGRSVPDSHVPHRAVGGTIGASEGLFYHDGRFSTLLDVVNHYDTQFNLQFSDTDKKDLIEYLKGI